MRRQIRGGEFKQYCACVRGVLAPAPVRHALSNTPRAGYTKKQRAQSPQYECLCDVRENMMHNQKRGEVLVKLMWMKRTKLRM
jgi:hypothetical protein